MFDLKSRKSTDCSSYAEIETTNSSDISWQNLLSNCCYQYKNPKYNIKEASYSLVNFCNKYEVSNSSVYDRVSCWNIKSFFHNNLKQGSCIENQMHDEKTLLSSNNVIQGGFNHRRIKQRRRKALYHKEQWLKSG